MQAQQLLGFEERRSRKWAAHIHQLCLRDKMLAAAHQDMLDHAREWQSDTPHVV